MFSQSYADVTQFSKSLYLYNFQLNVHMKM